MLGGNEFRLRRGFGLRPRHSYGANAPPQPAGPSLVRHLYFADKTKETPVTAMVTGVFLCRTDMVFPLVFPLQYQNSV